MKTTHTAGPWRWEINAKHKNIALVGGKPRYDLTVMDFTRWGMGGAAPRLRDLAHDGMNILHRACDRPDWIAPFQGREHHADWCAAITHADMVLIAAAPVLLESLVWIQDHSNDPKVVTMATRVINIATGAPT